jgi:hypothetical protein
LGCAFWQSQIPNSSPLQAKAYSKGLNPMKFDLKMKIENVVPNFGVGRLYPLDYEQLSF